jgi:hypothetical protein
MIWFWLALATVAVAALLLVWILAEAHGIRRQAERALEAAAGVEERTRPLWGIPQTGQLLREGAETASASAAKIESLAEALAMRKGRPG